MPMMLMMTKRARKTRDQKLETMKAMRSGENQRR